MTYSVGFRAPSAKDLVTFFGDHVASTVTKADAFYQDPDLRSQENHGENEARIITAVERPYIWSPRCHRVLILRNWIDVSRYLVARSTFTM